MFIKFTCSGSEFSSKAITIDTVKNIILHVFWVQNEILTVIYLEQ